MLEQITANRQSCERLVLLGIEPKAFFWHSLELVNPNQDSKEWIVAQFRKPVPGPEMVPAWTFQEICALIGPRWEKPDLYKPEMVSKATVAESYPVFFPDKAKVFRNAADAAAEALIFLMEKGQVTAKDANYRYAKLFMP
jgi:hypothetical protein